MSDKKGVVISKETDALIEEVLEEQIGCGKISRSQKARVHRQMLKRMQTEGDGWLRR
jgi:hypothetical protein